MAQIDAFHTKEISLYAVSYYERDPDSTNPLISKLIARRVDFSKFSDVGEFLRHLKAMRSAGIVIGNPLLEEDEH